MVPKYVWGVIYSSFTSQFQSNSTRLYDFDETLVEMRDWKKLVYMPRAALILKRRQRGLRR